MLTKNKSAAHGKPMIQFYGKLLYGAGALPYAAVSQTCMGLLMLFATDAHNMPAWLAGIALALGFLFSAAADPLAAYLSDRTKSVMLGRRFGYILCGMFLTALLNVVLFTMPLTIDVWLKFIWLAVFASVLNIFISAGNVPHASLAGELAGDRREHTAITRLRRIFFLAGLAVPTFLLAFLIKDTKVTDGYITLAFVNSSIVLIFGMLSFAGAYPHLPRLNAKAQGDILPKMKFRRIFSSFFEGFKDRECRNILTGYTVSMMSAAFLTGAGLHFFRYTMNFTTAEISAAAGALFLFIVLSQPVWMRLAQKYNKKTLILCGTITALAGILIIAVFFSLDFYGSLPGKPVYFFAAAMAVIGVGSGAMHAVPSLMLSAAGDGKSGSESRARCMPFMFKSAQGLVMLIAGGLLSASGFSGAKQTQSALTLEALGWAVILGSALSLGIAVFFYVRARKPEG